MTTRPPISCEEFSATLPALLEREVDEATREAMETHALGCSECGDLLADLRKLRVSAASLPELTPSRDLWAGIEARISAPVAALEPVRMAAERRRRRYQWLRPAAAAAALVIATAGVTYVVTARTLGNDQARTTLATVNPADTNEPMVTRPETLVATNEPSTNPATKQNSAAPTAPARASFAASSGSARSGSRAQQPSSRNAVGGEGAVAVLASNVRKPTAEETYGAEIARLRRIVDEHRDALDSATVDVIQKNLVIIDDAITQCRAALARDPNSRVLMENLNEALGSKLELLRTAAVISARS